MSETLPVATIDSEVPTRTPEHQAMIDKFKGLADMAATWTEQHGAPVRNEVDEASGTLVEIHDGLRFRDVEAFLGDINPQAPQEQTAVDAARLFNRMAIETHGMSAPDDLSQMDTTSETATLTPLEVIGYATAHLKAHLELDNISELHETINESVGKYMEALGYDASTSSGSEAIQVGRDFIYDSIKNRHPASDYPTLPEY